MRSTTEGRLSCDYPSNCKGGEVNFWHMDLLLKLVHAITTRYSSHRLSRDNVSNDSNRLSPLQRDLETRLKLILLRASETRRERKKRNVGPIQAK
jgi:hypothetical protein